MGIMDGMMSSMMDSMSPGDKQDTMLKMMPEMLKRIKGSEIMNLIGGWMSSMMFITGKSRFGFDETIKKVIKAGKESGWYHPSVNNHFEIDQNFEYSNPNKVASVAMCIPRKAHEILKENQKLAVMMPLKITVHEKDSITYITWMNIKMMGKMFGENISEIMKTADKDLRGTLKEILDTESVEGGEEK